MSEGVCCGFSGEGFLPSKFSMVLNQLVRFPLRCQAVRLSYFRLAVVRLPVVCLQVAVRNAFNGVFPFVRLRTLSNLVMLYTLYNNKRILENLSENSISCEV